MECAAIALIGAIAIGCGQPLVEPEASAARGANAADVSNALWSGAGPNPCIARDPIELVAPTQARDQTISLPARAAICVEVDASTAAEDVLSVAVDGGPARMVTVCRDRQTRPCLAADTPFVLAVPLELDAGLHAIHVAAARAELRVFARGPAITSFAPATARPGERVTIRGQGFTADTTVTAGDVPYAVARAREDELVVTVPDRGPRAAFTVQNALGSSASRGMFEIDPSLCEPAYTLPAYTRPADDSAGVQALIEAGGASTASDFVAIGAGNLCGTADPELAAAADAISVLRGPTPHVISSGAAGSWRALAVGNLEPWPQNTFDYDAILAVGQGNVAVIKADPTTCALATDKTLTIDGATDWIGVAIGDFDGDHTKEAILVRRTAPSFFMVKQSGDALQATMIDVPDSPSIALAAGDLDGDGVDELIKLHSPTDGTSPSVLVYKLVGGRFALVASSHYGNTAGYAWSAVAVGDFNGDGTASIALVGNGVTNFVMLGLVPGLPELVVLATSNGDSVPGQPWRGAVATDLIAGGGAELVAMRHVVAPYRANFFVYGDGVLRAGRQSAMANVKAQAYFERFTDSAGNFQPWTSATFDQVVALLTESHTNTMEWQLRDADDYEGLMKFLEMTKHTCIDGKQLRVWAVLWTSPLSPPASGAFLCSLPTDQSAFRAQVGLPAWSEASFFPEGLGSFQTCGDYPAWGALLGRLSQDYPHLVGVGFDDFNQHIPPSGKTTGMTEDDLSRMMANLHAASPALSFAPTIYYPTARELPDLGRMLDSFVYFFRNERVKENLADSGVPNAPREFCYVRPLLPAGRQPILGVYFTAHSKLGQPTTRYSYELARMVLSRPYLGFAGTTVYEMQRHPAGVTCSDSNFLVEFARTIGTDGIGNDRGCTVQKLYSDTDASTVSDLDLTAAACLAPPSDSDPFGYVYNAHGDQDVVYVSGDRHVHDIWRTADAIGTSDLSAIAISTTTHTYSTPLADYGATPSAYVVPGGFTNNVVVRDPSGKLHVLSWSTGTVNDRDLTMDARGNASGYAASALASESVLFRGANDHLHALWWSSSSAGDDDLTNESGAPRVTGEPFGYVFGDAQVAVFRGVDGNLHDVYWWQGAPGHDNLTELSGAAPPAPGSIGDPVAYVASTYGVQDVFYVGTDQNVHELYFSTGAVGHTDLTYALPFSSLPAGSKPSAHFVAADGTNHVVYTTASGHIEELFWTQGAVSARDLTALAFEPQAATGRAASYAAGGTQHVLYRSPDGHLHELTWGTSR